MSQKAEAQAAGGVYLKGGPKHDAAHLMNVTVRDDRLAMGQGLTANQSLALQELRVMSAATTMQLKENNVGPDKVIDGCITTFTQYWAGQVDAGAPLPNATFLINNLATACGTALAANPKAGTPAYADAIAGVTDALNDRGRQGPVIDEDVKAWINENAF